MKKRIVIFVLIFCLFIMNMTSILAKEVSFADIKSRYIELIGDSDYNILDEENKIAISLTNPTYGPYSIEFNYDNNKITYTNSRDVSSVNDATKVYYNFTDFYFISSMIYTLFDVYGLSADVEITEEDYDDLGITLETGEEFNYETDNGVHGSTSPITSLVIDLTKFNTFTESYQSESNDTSYVTQIIGFYKQMMNPMTENIFSFNIPDEISDNFNDMIDDITNFDIVMDEEPKQEVTVSKQTVKVPSTKFNSIYILAGFLIVSVAIGVLVYIIMIKK